MKIIFDAKLLVLLDNNEFYFGYLNDLLPLSSTILYGLFYGSHFIPFLLKKWLKLSW